MLIKLNQILFSAALILLAGTTQANEVCNTISDCRELKQQAEKKIYQLEGSLSQVGDFLRRPNGKIITYLDRSEASYLCAAKGMQLPTVRALAIEGTKNGAKILELDQVPGGKVPWGFKLISVEYPDTMDEFYYSNKEYIRPEGDKGEQVSWSSSPVVRSNDIYNTPNVYIFEGYSGAISLNNSTSGGFFSSVRCVRPNIEQLEME